VPLGGRSTTFSPLHARVMPAMRRMVLGSTGWAARRGPRSALGGFETTAKGCAKRTVATRLLAGSARSHLGSPPGVDWSCTLRGRHYACADGRVPCHQGSPRIWGFRRCLSRSQLAAPLVLLPLDYAGRRDRKHVHTGRRRWEGHRVPDWCRLSLDTRVTGIAGIPSRRSS
jgi:hypothetical protein